MQRCGTIFPRRGEGPVKTPVLLLFFFPGILPAHEILSEETPVIAARDSTDRYEIFVDCGKVLGPVNRGIFGTNLISVDYNLAENYNLARADTNKSTPATVVEKKEPTYASTDYGAGLWDADKKKPVKEVIDLLKKVKISSLRYPGGCGAHLRDWKWAVGPREHYLFGLNEFLEVCSLINAEPVIIVSYFTGDAEDAADMVRYLNGDPADKIPKGRENWAEKRVKWGHKKPFHVTYFEIGNEVWHGNHTTVDKVSSNEYGKRYLPYYHTMKSADPAIKIGAIMNEGKWGVGVMKTVGRNLDFASFHWYPACNIHFEGEEEVETFSSMLFFPDIEIRRYLSDIYTNLELYCGKKVPVAFTEVNFGYHQARHPRIGFTLATALVMAEILREFLLEGDRFLFANQWLFVNEFWGMVGNDYWGKPKPGDGLYKPYRKRPIYLLYQLYADHFGDMLVAASTGTGGPRFQGLRKSKANEYLRLLNADTKVPHSPQLAEPYLTTIASLSKKRDTLFIIVNNRGHDSLQTVIRLKNYIAAGTAATHTLNGSWIGATNENGITEVRITDNTAAFESSGAVYTFPPYSVTALVLPGKS